MNVSLKSKIVMATLGLLAVFAFLVIADLGISAGRVHKGVDVKGVEVGGLTRKEAGQKLTDVGAELQSKTLTFKIGDLSCVTTAEALGWNPRPYDTADLALEVGRSGGPLTALWDRARAWVGGVSIPWDDLPDGAKVEEFLGGCVSDGEAAGVQVDRRSLSLAVLKAVGRWPHRAVHTL